MAKRAARAVIVADSSKIGRRAFATLGQDTFDTLITDSGHHTGTTSRVR